MPTYEKNGSAFSLLNFICFIQQTCLFFAGSVSNSTYFILETKIVAYNLLICTPSR